MESLRGALETRIWAEADELNAVKQTDAEIQKSVKQGIQQYVDELVAAMSASPMEDPDYKPEDDMEDTPKSEDQEDGAFVVYDEGIDMDTRPWREQLKDALEHVQEIGRMDGAAFAEMICETFRELGNKDPAMDLMTDLYDRIKTDFANEAEEELDDTESATTETTEVESEEETEQDTEEEEEEKSMELMEEDWEDTLEYVRDVGRKDGTLLAQDLCDIFFDEFGEEPSLEELTDLWQGIQDELAMEAEEAEDSEDDEESDYDPDNEDDQFTANVDALEDERYEATLDVDSDDDDEWEEALDHIRTLGQQDGEELAEDLCDFLAEELGEEPSLEQLTDVWQGIQDELIAEAEEETVEETEEEIEDSSDDDSDADAEYNPYNLEDQILATKDTVETEEFESTNFDEVADTEDDSNDDTEDDELGDALEHVRNIGKEDGEALAQNIFDLLCDVNGDEEEAFEQLADLWGAIQNGLAMEAQEESIDDSEDEDEVSEDEDLSPYETYQASAKVVANEWVSRGTEQFLNDEGREPTAEELLDTVRGFASELADEVIAMRNETETETETESDLESQTESEEMSDEDESLDESVKEYVRAIAREDGKVLAQDLCDIFFDEYGEEPSLEELTDLWQGIQDELAMEAEEAEDSEDDEESDYDPDNEEDQFMANVDALEDDQFEATLDAESDKDEDEDDEWEETLDHIRTLARQDGEALAENLCDILCEENEEEPSLEQLTNVWQGIQDKLIAEAEEEIDDSEEDEDSDYDSNNMADQVQARWDLEADIKYENELFDTTMLNTPISESQKGGGASWEVYFNEQDLSQQSESIKLQKAVESFKMRNQRVPTILDLKNMTEFLSVPNEVYDEETNNTTDDSEAEETITVLVSAVKETTTSKAFTVYFEDSKLSQEETEKIAVKMFQTVNKQEAAEEDLVRIRTFIGKEADLKEQEFLVPVKANGTFEDEEDDEDVVDEDIIDIE